MPEPWEIPNFDVTTASDEVLVYICRNASGLAQGAEAELERRGLDANRELRKALLAVKRSADHASRWVIGLTAALVLLTLVLVALTVVVARH